MQLAGGAQSVVLYVGDDPTTLTMEPVGDDAATKDINDMMREWWLVDGGDQLVSLEPVGEVTQAKLTGLKVGTTRLVAEVRGLGTLIIPVEVRERPAPDPQPEPEPLQPTGPATPESGLCDQNQSTELVKQAVHFLGIAVFDPDENPSTHFEFGTEIVEL